MPPLASQEDQEHAVADELRQPLRRHVLDPPCPGIAQQALRDARPGIDAPHGGQCQPGVLATREINPYQPHEHGQGEPPSRPDC